MACLMAIKYSIIAKLATLSISGMCYVVLVSHYTGCL